MIGEADCSWKANCSYEGNSKPPCPSAASALTEVTTPLIVFACIGTAQTSSQAKGWLSVVSELTLRLNEGIPAAPRPPVDVVVL